MTAKLVLARLFLIGLSAQANFAQTLPTKIKAYLNQHYSGWKFQADSCYPSEPGKALMTGNFNADKKLDYVVKFVRGKKGFMIAFLAWEQGYKPFVLHNTDAEEASIMNLGVLKKGELFGNIEGKGFRLKHDAPSDYHCESDVGGIHYYRNGKFVGY